MPRTFTTVLWLAAAAAHGQARGPAVACLDGLATAVGDRALRARLEPTCVRSTDRGAWALALWATPAGPAYQRALERHPDWAVRWASVRGEAGVLGVPAIARLSAWVQRARGDERLAACEVVLHVAARQATPPRALLAADVVAGAAAAERCTHQREALIARLERAYVGLDGERGLEALRAARALTGRTPARLVLDAAGGLGPQADAVLAGLLVEDAGAGGPPAGRALLDAASGADSVAVARVRAALDQRVAVAKAQLASPERLSRLDAVDALSALGPLGAQLLDGRLDDAEAEVRLHAAMGLARGEGRTPQQALAAALAGAGELPAGRRRRLVLALARLSDCGPALLAAVRRPEASVEDRTLAIEGLGVCAPKGGTAVLGGVLRTEHNPSLRAAAAEALASAGDDRLARQLIVQTLGEVEPEVLEAAARTAGALRLREAVVQLVGLLESGSEATRAAAARSLGTIGDPRASLALARALGHDAAWQVREAAAEALGLVGGTDGLNALTEAAAKDPHSRVQHVALGSLRKLGFQRASGP